MVYDDLNADDLEILDDFVSESLSSLKSSSPVLGEFSQNPGDLTKIDFVFRSIHTIKGNSAFLGLLRVKKLSHEIESVLDLFKAKPDETPIDAIDVVSEAVNHLQTMMASIKNRKPEVPDDEEFERLLAKLRLALTGKLQSNSSTAASVSASAGAPLDNAGKPNDDSVVALRGIADQLKSVAGEIDQFFKKSSLGAEATALIKRLDAISDQLTNSLTADPPVPVKRLLNKARKIAADVAAQSDKKVAVHVTGEEVSVPKSLSPVFDVALLHLVRNAVDHGIEPSERRGKSAKPETGNIWIQFFEKNGHVELVVKDDGRGINYRPLVKKALEKGLWPRDKRMTVAELPNLLFIPGLSSAGEVTDVSGRGVGMDAVKHQVDEAGGSVNVTSSLGKGTTFAIKLPVPV